MESFKDEWLIRALLASKLLDEAAVASLRQAGSPYASAELLRLNILTKRQLAQAVKAQHGVAFEELATGVLGKLALSLISERLCRKHRMIPFGVEADHIDVLMADPTDLVAPGRRGVRLGTQAHPVLRPAGSDRGPYRGGL